MIVQKEIVVDLYYQERARLGHEDAIASAAAIAGQEPETVREVVLEAVEEEAVA